MINFWKGKKVFITGCNGFVGSWLTYELFKQGADVTGLIRDHITRSNLQLLNLEKNINIVHGDITDFNCLRRCLAEYEIDTVFHLAAQPIVTVALKDPIGTFKANIEGTWNILEASRLLEVQRLIIASSDKAYGTHDKLPYDETFPLKGQFPYDVSKTCSDLIAQTYFNTYELPLCITRNANIYGGGFQDKKIDSFQWGKNEKTNIEKFINTCKIIKSRRDESLHSSEEALLRKIYEYNK